MSKYDKVTVLKLTNARKQHICNWCERIIYAGEDYFRESLTDKFLQSLNRKIFCNECYSLYGEKLMKMKKKRKRTQENTSGQTNLFN